MRTNSLYRKCIGSTFLVTGTCIGAGMLALPVATAPLGLSVSVILLTIIWGFMCFTGLLILEATLWFPRHISFVGLAGQTLGRAGQVVTWLVFLLVLYSLLAAYITGGGAVTALLEERFLHHTLPVKLNYLPWVVLFPIIVYLGAKAVDLVNRFLLIGLIAAFALLTTIATAHISLLDVTYRNWYYVLLALPVLTTAFGFNIVIPSLRDYLDQEASRLLPKIIFLGTLVTLIVYLIWEVIIFGVIPVHGEYGLLAILHAGQPTELLAEAMTAVVQDNYIAIIMRFFIFFAIASSFVSISLGLFDLLADGLNISKNTQGKLLLTVLTFLPALIFAILYPKGFILALSYAGLFIAILHGILPAMMVWVGRYRLNLATSYRVFGGKFALGLVVLLSVIVIIAQFAGNFVMV